jgi:flagellar hook-length control protein FliK
MSIVIVSAPPTSAPPVLANIPAEADSTGLIQDFTSLLLGQLAAAQSGAGLNLAATPRFTGDSGQGKPTNDEDTEAGDPLVAFAMLAFFEPEGRAVSVKGGEPSADPAEMIARAPFADQGAADQGKLAASPLPAPASEPAAKFAALIDGMAGEDIARIREPAPPSPVAGAVTTSVHAGREAAPPAIPIPSSLHSRDWSNDFAQTVTWVATRRYQSADLTLNPPALGNIEISLKFDNDRSTATAVFVSSSAEVRETIETALPKLREMLAGAGIELGQANVSAESFRQAAGNGQGAKGDASPSGNELAILEPDPQAARDAAPLGGAGRGLVDMFV